MVRMSAHLNLPAAHGALQFGVVQRCVGQQPRRSQRGVCIHAQHTDAGNIGGVGGGPTTGGRVGDEAFPVRTITGDRMHFGHARSAAFELEVEAELINQSVVQKVDGNHVLVGALHARDDLPGAVEDGPVEVGAFGDVGLNVHRCVGVSGKKLGGACSVAEGWARPVGLRGRCDVDVVNEPVVAAGAAATGLVDSELRVGVQGRCRQGGHELEVAGLGSSTAEGLEDGPAAGGRLVLELQVFTAVRCFTAARTAFVNPSVEGNVGATGEVHHRRRAVGRASVGPKGTS